MPPSLFSFAGSMSPSSTGVPTSTIAASFAIRMAVPAASPVIMTLRTSPPRKLSMVARVSGRNGFLKSSNPSITRLCSASSRVISATCTEPLLPGSIRAARASTYMPEKACACATLTKSAGMDPTRQRSLTCSKLPLQKTPLWPDGECSTTELMVMVLCEKSKRRRIRRPCAAPGASPAPAGPRTLPGSCGSRRQPVAWNMFTSTAFPTTPASFPEKVERECALANPQSTSRFQPAERGSSSKRTWLSDSNTEDANEVTLLWKGPSPPCPGNLRSSKVERMQWTPKN
mmetsp:Transcript_57165/g.167335  ORF Transcript_57165/g.167335 Transcript_57165/m.167335 type:complete len:287 (-) Transcript_57165:175-1035(-)